VMRSFPSLTAFMPLVHQSQLSYIMLNGTIVTISEEF
jgi:hypothetical protein